MLLKAAPDRDLYCLWSTVVDNVTWIGTRDEALRNEHADRVARADTYGTSVVTREDNPSSDYTSREGGWDDRGFVVTNITGSPKPFYWLPRGHLAAYLDAIMSDGDDETSMYAALVDIPDEED